MSLEKLVFEGESYTSEIFQQYIKMGGEVWVIEEDGEIIAYILYIIYDRMAHLISIAVHPNHRGKGLGRKLISKMEEEAKRQGAERVWLEVKANNPARTFYRRLGYREIIRVERYYPNGNDAIRMMKEIL